MGTKLHVGNIPPTAREDDLRSMFGRFGTVESVEIVKDAGTGLSRRFAIVEMFHDADAKSAIDRLNFTQYSGRTIGVSRVRVTSLHG